MTEFRPTPRTKARSPMTWVSVVLRSELEARMATVIVRTNDRRPVDRRFITKSSFIRAAIEDAVDEAERALGIVAR